MVKNSLPIIPQLPTDKAAMTLLTDLGDRKVYCKTFRTGDRMPPHYALSDVFVLILDGQIDITIAEETLRFQPSEWMVFPALLTHALDCVEDASVLIFR